MDNLLFTVFAEKHLGSYDQMPAPLTGNSAFCCRRNGKDALAA
jgi:hypothetical protein